MRRLHWWRMLRTVLPTVPGEAPSVMRIAIAFALSILAVTAHAAYQDDWGPPVGAVLPALAAEDQSGVERRVADLAGEKGLLVFFVRSADW